MHEPDAELLLRHLQNLQLSVDQLHTRLRRVEAALGLMIETGRLVPLGRALAPSERLGGGDDAENA